MSRADIEQAGQGGPDFTPKDWPTRLTPAEKALAEALREHLVANLFDGSDDGQVTATIALFVSEIRDVVMEFLFDDDFSASGFTITETEQLERLEASLRLHNKTPSGRTRECLPGCIACAALSETEEPSRE